MIKVVCEECGKEFEIQPNRLKHRRGKYCSKVCLYKAMRKIVGENNPGWNRIKVVCLECKKEFEVTPSRKKDGRRYCSKACWDKARKKVVVGNNHPRWKGGCIKRNCLECGKEFITHWGEGKYCSRQCAGKARRGLLSREKNPSWRGGKVKLVCETCGKEFEVHPVHVRGGEKKYCSKKCMYKSLEVAFVGENNPCWKGGVSFEPYCIKFNREFKERVRAFFGYVCQSCGHIWQPGEEKLAVHHVNYRKDSCCDVDVKPIFVPLCFRTCHTKTNHNRDYWEKYFTDLINEKYGGKCYFSREEMEEFKTRGLG